MFTCPLFDSLLVAMTIVQCPLFCLQDERDAASVSPRVRSGSSPKLPGEDLTQFSLVGERRPLSWGSTSPVSSSFSFSSDAVVAGGNTFRSCVVSSGDFYCCWQIEGQCFVFSVVMIVQSE